MVVTAEALSFLDGEIVEFLEKFCTRDKRSITRAVHCKMMISCFYYIDYEGQGWYVLDDSEGFHRKLDGDEYWIYGELYQEATSYE